jgi:MarR family transcriptional regulator, negative regulator of the multidrug operon emrRAB
MLSSMETTDLQRCSLCRLCDESVCTNCPIPANFRGLELAS